MLLSINPFKPLNIYTEELRQIYQGKEQQRNPPWANTSHSDVYHSAFSYCTLAAECLTKRFSPFQRSVPLIVFYFFNLFVSALCFSHVYAIADAAFSQSQASIQEQCIIIRYWPASYICIGYFYDKRPALFCYRFYRYTLCARLLMDHIFLMASKSSDLSWQANHWFWCTSPLPLKKAVSYFI